MSHYTSNDHHYGNYMDGGSHEVRDHNRNYDGGYKRQRFDYDNRNSNNFRGGGGRSGGYHNNNNNYNNDN